MDHRQTRLDALPQRIHTVARQLRWWWGVALVLVTLAIGAPVQAAVFPCPSGDVVCLIRAINTANETGEDDTITLEAGTYTLTAVHNSTDGLNGLPSVTSPLIIRGAGAATTSVACAPDTFFRILHVAATATLTLEGLTLQGCDSGNFPGGGFYNDAGTVLLTHSMVANEAGAGRGGGFYNHAGTVAVTNSTLTGFALAGGGFYNEGGTVALTQTTIAHGGATVGGGFYNEAGLVTLAQTTIADHGSSGGGGFFNEAGMITLTDGAITNNGGEGGAGFWNSDGTVTLTNCTVAGNEADFGGAAGFENISGTVTLTNCTIVDNASVGFGGATGGLSNLSGTVTLVNTILARNTGGEEGTPDCRGAVTSQGHNLIGDPTGCTITVQPSDLTGNPGLGRLVDDGTPGHAHLPLLAASRAIDAGNDMVCPETDQLGQPRVGRCDIGAIEFQHPIVLVNDLVDVDSLRSTFTFTPDPTGCPEGFVGTFSFDMRLTNTSERLLTDLFIEVMTLTNDNLLQNAEGPPFGVGARLTVPAQDGFTDGVLSSAEFVDVPFIICLQQRQPFQFLVAVSGVVEASAEAHARAQPVR